jgi:probable HAF family extracellular repeat protein
MHQRHSRITSIELAATLLLAWAATVFGDGPTFTAIDFPGAAATTPKGINSKGEIVGFYKDSAGATHGFLFANGQFTSVDVPGASSTQATAINAGEDIAGLYVDSAGTHGFVLSAGQFNSIDVAGASLTDIWGINGDGDLVGFTSDGKAFHGFFQIEDMGLNLLDFPDAATTLAFGINCQGRIVGQYTASDGNTHGFLRGRDGAFTVFDMPGDVNPKVGTQARGINSAGQIVGWFTDTGGSNHGFLRSKSGRFTQIDFPTSQGAQALQISDRGDIVGSYGGVHGFLLSQTSQ